MAFRQVQNVEYTPIEEEATANTSASPKYRKLTERVEYTPVEEPGFMERVQGDFARRTQKLGDIQKNAANQTGYETAAQEFGQGFGVIGDVAGQGLVSAYKNIVPEKWQEKDKEITAKILDTRIGKYGLQALQAGGEVWDEFAKNNPRAARNIEAAANIGGFMSGFKLAPKVIAQPIRQLNELRPSIPGADDIRRLSSEKYKIADAKGGVLTPDFTNDFVSKIQELQPQTNIGKAIGGDSAFTKVINRITGTQDEAGNIVGGIANQPITLQAAQEFDEFLGDEIDNFTDMGKLTKQGKKLLDIQTTFRQAIEAAPESMVVGGKEGFNELKEARKLWSASRKMADIERIIQRAEMSDHPATAIKTGLRTLLTGSKASAYTMGEKRLIKRAAQSSVPMEVLRTLGTRLLPIIQLSTGGGLAGTAAAQGVSIAARGIAARSKLNQAKRINKEIIKNALPKKEIK